MHSSSESNPVHNSDVRRPSVDQYNPAKLSASLSVLLDRNAPLARLDAGVLLDRLKRVKSENVRVFDDSYYETFNFDGLDAPTKPGLTRRLSSIRLVNLESGLVKELSVRARRSSADTRKIQITNDPDFDILEGVDVEDIFQVITRQGREPPSSLESEKEDAPGPSKANVCEAVLRAVFAPKFQGEYEKEEEETVETLRDAFALPGSQFDNAERRATYAARYRRAELKAKFRALSRDKDETVQPNQFGDQASYESWKKQELDKILELITSLGGELPPFSGSVQILKIAAYHLKPAKWIRRLQCSRGRSTFQVYYTVKVLSSTIQSPSYQKAIDLDGDDATSLLEPAFLSKVVVCKGSADWQGESPWITVNSLQDQILIEFWERREEKCIKFRIANKKLDHGCMPNVGCGLKRKGTGRRKTAPRIGDLFLGQKYVNFSHIERQALADGGMQGKAPEELENLADEKNRDCMSVVQMQFAACCKNDSRDTPPNELLLQPPVEDLGRAYDCLIRVAFQADKAVYKLGKKWEKVVEDFAAHYRIRTERCQLGLVQILAEKFEPTFRYLSTVVDDWSPVCTAAREGKLTKTELAMHSDIARILAKPAEEALENFQTTFNESQPAGSLSKLLELLALILCWDPNVNEILIPLRGWIEDSCEKRVRSKLFYDANGEKQEEITLQNLIETVKLVRSDIEEHGKVYQREFPPDIKLPTITARIHYKLVIEYTKSFVDSVAEKTFTKEYGELASELLALQQDVERHGIQLPFADIHHIFEKNISEWLAVMEPRMFDFVMNSCSGERWEPLTKATTMTETTFLYSGSVIDLYWMMTEYVDELTSRLLILPSGLQYVWHIEAGICAAVQLYVGRLEKLCLRDLPEEERGTVDDDTDESDSDIGTITVNAPHAPSQYISMSLCVKLNNINEVIQRQQELESYLDKKLQFFVPSVNDDDELSMSEDFGTEERFQSVNDDLDAKNKVGEKFKDLGKVIHHTYNNVIGSIVERMQGRLRLELQTVLKSVPEGDEYAIEDVLEPLTSYMDENIVVMNDWLHPTIFKRLLKEMAKALFFCMEEFVLNKDEDPTPMTPHQREMLKRSLTELYDYFDGYGQSNGRGLTLSQTHQACARLHDEPLDEEVELHVLDYLWLLKQRKDDEAKELVATQSLIATEKTTQFIFGLPRDEEIIASFSCRDASKKEGTLYITTHHIAFAENNVVAAHNPRLFVLSFERLMSVHTKGENTVVLVPFNLRPKSFTNLSDSAAVPRTIFDQIEGSGTYLEKSMRPSYSKQNSLSDIVLKEYHCSKRQGVIRQLRGTLVISATHITFEPLEILKQERESMDFASISNVAERKGLRTSCLVIDLKYGGHIEFVEFTKTELSLPEIVKEIQKLVLST
ncbi:hypothetical protein AXG93_2675s1340 [Marchantia polymorpha subsp. ruderalis]|uniref:MHD2 domain-containing protein n=1 Tax=Marchantia polymorpha subsp. ruderalis TaxID=1480154 RepID=A0A176VP57_MARPO|nr:hypothetical protein AXG93_2675s1340 [Marchantia polymorpha subsp. ruderalis]